MEVKIKPLSGCMRIVVGVLTLGLAPFFQWLNTRNWPKMMDDQGLTTLKGARIEWNQFTKIRRVITKMGSSSNTVAEHYELASTKGKVIVDMYHLMDSEKVIDYIWQHLPEPVKQIQK